MIGVGVGSTAGRVTRTGFSAIPSTNTPNVVDARSDSIRKPAKTSVNTMFDSFPMFSYDGKKLVFSSNRNNGGTRSTNLFIADWIE